MRGFAREGHVFVSIVLPTSANRSLAIHISVDLYHQEKP